MAATSAEQGEIPEEGSSVASVGDPSRPPATLEEWARADGRVRAVEAAVGSGRSFLLITGAAGTGKSTLLRLLAEDLGHPPILAPTGIAALKVGGQTLHSFFRLPIGVQVCANDGRDRPLAAYRALSTIIIDEISMVRADVMDKINWILQAARQSAAPWGGVRVIAFGDMLQLPPVVGAREWGPLRSLGYRSPHFFDSAAVKDSHLGVRVLDKVHRQREGSFLQVLNTVRLGRVSPASLGRLNSRVLPRPVAEAAGSLILTPRRTDADVYNALRLNALPGPERTYTALVEGRFPRKRPAARELHLRCGARVMCLRNDPWGRWVNGSLGTVRECQQDAVVVELDCSGALCTLDRVEWEQYAFSLDRQSGNLRRRIVGRYIQIPLALAWSATVHKSQGLTLDRLHVDLGRGAFAPGQLYVALSRVRSEQGLTLARAVVEEDLIVDDRVLAFLRSRSLFDAA